MELHTRHLRYFVTLAEELHFSRAAGRLFIAQQSLSAQIRELEERIGVKLFDRSSRRVELTPAGEAFLAEVRVALEALNRGISNARESAKTSPATLVIGHMVGAAFELTDLILAEFVTRYPHVNVKMREYPYADPSVGLASGAVDVGFVRVPIDLPHAHFEVLFTEPRGICVANKHPLATRTSVSVQEILDEPLITTETTDSTWMAFWNLNEYRNDKPVMSASRATTKLEELWALESGQLSVLVTPMSSIRFSRPGLCFIPIHDISGSAMTLGWCATRENDLTRAFIRTAKAVRDRESELIARFERGQRPVDSALG